jgi:hypothetical protein
LTAAQAIEDAIALGAQDARSVTGPGAPFRIAQPEPIKDRTAGVAWTYERPRNTLVVDANVTRERSDFDPLFDRNLVGGGIRYLRRMRPTLSFDVRATYWHEEFTTSAVRDHEIDAGFGLAYIPSPQQSLTLRYDYFNRTSTIEGDRFRESRIGLLYTYRVL